MSSTAGDDRSVWKCKFSFRCCHSLSLWVSLVMQRERQWEFVFYNSMCYRGKKHINVLHLLLAPSIINCLIILQYSYGIFLPKLHEWGRKTFKWEKVRLILRPQVWLSCMLYKWQEFPSHGGRDVNWQQVFRVCGKRWKTDHTELMKCILGFDTSLTGRKQNWMNINILTHAK